MASQPKVAFYDAVQSHIGPEKEGLITIAAGCKKKHNQTQIVGVSEIGKTS